MKRFGNGLKNLTELFELLKSSLFTDVPVRLSDWQFVFREMEDQAVAALPEDWVVANLPFDSSWSTYCFTQQREWVRLMYGQDQLLSLLEKNGIPSVIIKGTAAAMYYPHPSLRTMGDVDVLVKRCDHKKAAEVLEANGYELAYERDHALHHYNYRKDDISIELHKRLPVVDDEDEKLLDLFEQGIENREWGMAEGVRFPVLPPVLNGFVLILHINQHLREGLGLRQIIDWMMYVNAVSIDTWNELIRLLRSTGMERLALTVTVMCREYLGLQKTIPGCEGVASQVCDNLMSYIMEKGNFGRKAGIDGKTEAFALSATEQGGFFRRLQEGGLDRWNAVRKYPILRPFAWVYQGFRIFGILIRNRKSVKEIMELRERGREQRKLIEALGLGMDRTIHLN